MTQKQFINAINRHGVKKVEKLDEYSNETKHTLFNGKNIYSSVSGGWDGELDFYYESESERAKRLKPKKGKKGDGLFKDLQLLVPTYLPKMIEKYSDGNFSQIKNWLSNPVDIPK